MVCIICGKSSATRWKMSFYFFFKIGERKLESSFIGSNKEKEYSI